MVFELQRKVARVLIKVAIESFSSRLIIPPIQLIVIIEHQDFFRSEEQRDRGRSRNLRGDLADLLHRGGGLNFRLPPRWIRASRVETDA